MLDLSIKYEEQLHYLLAKCSLDPYYMYWFGQGGYNYHALEKSTSTERNFVSLDKDGNIVGNISYYIDTTARRACSFGFISFDPGNSILIRDMYECIADIFEKYHMNTMSWCAYTDNPVINSYRRICKKLGGREVGVDRQVTVLLDGKLHDSTSFDVIKEEYFESEFYKQRCRRKERLEAKKKQK